MACERCGSFRGGKNRPKRTREEKIEHGRRFLSARSWNRNLKQVTCVKERSPVVDRVVNEPLTQYPVLRRFGLLERVSPRSGLRWPTTSIITSMPRKRRTPPLRIHLGRSVFTARTAVICRLGGLTNLTGGFELKSHSLVALMERNSETSNEEIHWNSHGRGAYGIRSLRRRGCAIWQNPKSTQPIGSGRGQAGAGGGRLQGCEGYARHICRPR